ncbi:MAG: zf-HC2 domain-containing protein [Myxococcales bacterium]|nr:zf-HC2 domain-containing protein [Myxococcales bacterium]
MLFADGELEPSRAIQVESHLKVCDSCRAELELVQAMRKSLRQSCARRASSDARARIELTILNAESAKADAKKEAPFLAAQRVAEARATQIASSNDARSRRWAVVGAVAVAACFVLIVAARATNRESALKAHTSVSMASLFGAASAERAQHSSRSSAANSNDWNFDSVVDQLVALHANPLPPEEKNPEQLMRFEPYVGVPVKRSALSLLKVGATGSERASFDGARLYAVRESQNAAALQYKVHGHRLTVYVFDSRLIPMGRTRLRPRVVRTSDQAAERPSPVYVGNVRGFSIAAAERSGVGYALASDLDEEKTVQMVASF